MLFRRLHSPLHKTLAFGLVHVGVGWALTGRLAVAGTMALVEPAANSVALYFFERWWMRREPAPSALPHAA